MSARRALRLVLVVSSLSAACASRSPGPTHPALQIPPAAGWTEEGVASWYGGRDGFEGKPTASGEIYDSSLLTAAHRELPLGSIVEVTNLDNGKAVRVRINDRGPFIAGRIIDLSRVKVGPFDSRREAQRELQTLEDEGFEGIVVPTD